MSVFAEPTEGGAGSGPVDEGAGTEAMTAEPDAEAVRLAVEAAPAASPVGTRSNSWMKA